MKCTQYYPVIVTGDMAGTVAFWCPQCRFRPLYGWFGAHTLALGGG